MLQKARQDDLLQAFDAETSRLLRQRFFWFLGVVAVIYLLARVWVFASYGGMLLAGAVASEEVLESSIRDIRLGSVGMWIVLLATLADAAVWSWAWWRASRRGLTRQETSALTLNFLLYLGISQILVAVILRTVGFPFVIGLYHFAGCLILPWSAMQAAVPIAVLLGVNAVAVLVFSRFGVEGRVTIMLLSLLAAVPGTMIAWFIHSRRMEDFRVRTLQNRYREIRRELVDAQRIHEALFPQPVRDGPLRMDYRYEPMRQIGGDYLYARFGPPSPACPEGTQPLNVLLLDVTGHGIAAALTVNRLYGEVERLFGENPGAGPGELLKALNSYVHLTLANHSIYVTALCLRMDCRVGTLEYASGGHPPAFLVSRDGSLKQLQSTAFVLGACAGADFEPDVQVVEFRPGDTVIAYTDGALEARNDEGRMLGIAGLQRALHVARATKPSLADAGEGVCAAVLSAVEAHRLGPPEDDTLIVEIGFCPHAQSGVAPAAESDRPSQIFLRGGEPAATGSTRRA